MSASSFHRRASDIGSRLTQWLIGQLADSSPLNDVVSAVNADPQTAQVSTITVDTVTNSADYTFTVAGSEITITSDASAVNTEIVAAIVLAINEHPLARALCTAAATSATVVTLTANRAGVAFTVSDSDSKLSCATSTANDTADAVEFGRLVVQTGFADGARLCAKAAAAKFTAQVDTLTVVYAASDVYYVTIGMLDGSTPQIVGVAADTDTATTATAIVTAINAIMPANTVLAATAGGGIITLTAEVAGKGFITSHGTKSGTASRSVLALTTSGPSTDVNQYALGISQHTYDEEETERASGVVVYPANAGVKVVRAGRVAVACSEAVTNGAAVYVELGVTDDNGKFFASGSATRVKLNRARWERNERTGDDNDVAVLRLAPA